MFCKKAGLEYWGKGGGVDDWIEDNLDEYLDSAVQMPPEQGMQNIHSTFEDARLMYDFLREKVCHDVRDITVMCDRRDFFRLIKKPSYEGDFLT